MDEKLDNGATQGELERFSRFNIFRALKLERQEIRHSNFLAWLLDSAQSHGQGDLFLRALVEAIDQGRPRDQRLVKRRSPRTVLFRDAYVGREFNQFDLLIFFPSGRVLVGIENKVFAKQNPAQLSRYADQLCLYYPEWRRVLVWLTINGQIPSDKRWRPLPHRQVIRAIANVQDRMLVGTPSEVRTFIQHYIQVVEDLCAQQDETGAYA